MCVASHVAKKTHHSKNSWYPCTKRVRPTKFQAKRFSPLWTRPSQDFYRNSCILSGVLFIIIRCKFLIYHFLFFMNSVKRFINKVYYYYCYYYYYVYLANFLKTNLTKFAVIWVKKRQKACFISPRSSKIIVTKEKKEKKKERGEAKEEKKKKTMVSLLVFIITTLKILLAIALSKIWLDTYVLGYLSMKWNRAISFHCQWIHSSSSSLLLLLLLLTYCKFSFNISGAEYIYFFSVLHYLLLFIVVFNCFWA